MKKADIRVRYFALLKAHVARPKEKHLAAVAELGRELLLADVPPEEIAELHEQALHRLAEECPDMALAEAARLISAPLIELFMAYGLALRDQLEGRRPAKGALRESEEKYRTMFQTAPVSIWEEDFSELKAAIDRLKAQGVTDFRKYLDEQPDFLRAASRMVKVLDVNDATLRMHGAKSKAELLGSLDKVFAPESYGRFREELIAIAEGEAAFEVETVTQTLQGERLDVIVRLEIPSELSRFDHLLVSVLDITERKRAEKQIRLLSHAVRSVNDCIGITDMDYKTIFVNEAFEKTYGYSQDELLGQDLRLLRPENEVQDVDDYILSETLKGGWQGELWNKRRDGKLIPIWLSTSVIRDDQGNPLALVGVSRDITEQKRAEQALKEQEQFLRQIIDAMPNLVFVKDKEGKYILVNQAMADEFGETVQGMIGKTIADVLPSKDQAEEFRRDDQEVMSTRRPKLIPEARYTQPKTGEKRWFQTAKVPLVSPGGGAAQLLGVITDITVRKEVEEALVRLQEQTSQLVGELDVDRMVQGILDAALVIVRADLAALPLISDDGAELRYRAAEGQQAEVLLGWKLPLTAPSLCSMAVRERKPVRTDNLMDDPRVSRHLAEALGMETGISVPLIKGDRVLGALTLLRRRGAFTEEEGRLLTIFTNYVVELIESARLYEQMCQAEARYRDLYNNAPDGYDSVDADGVIREMNATMLKWLGYRREEVIGKTKFVDMLTPEGQRQFGRLLARCRREGHLEGVELEMVGKDDKRLPVRVNMAMTRDAEGRDQGFRATVREISKEKELEAQLLQAQKLESLGTLVGGIAHDFNNMLTGILGYTQLLLRGMKPEGKVYERVQQIQLLGERAADMVNQLLTFSREELSQKRPLELHPFLRELLGLLKHTIPESIEVELRLAVDKLMVVADPTQLQQVVMNLAINARDAMPEGGRLRLETAPVQLDEEFCRTHPDVVPGSYVRLRISDTGEGIAPGIGGRIFDPFFTTKEVGKGTGLGLAVVYGIVKKHGGVIEVKSEVGRGTTVEVTLPAAEAVEAAEAAEAADGNAMREVEGGTETILLVEDEPMVLEVGRMALEEFGYQVLTAHNGEEAVAVYRNRGDEIALVILDMVMPKMGGREALRQLQRLNPDVKVLMTTGYGADQLTGDELADAGSCGLLRKPFQVQELAWTVRATLDLKPGSHVIE